MTSIYVLFSKDKKSLVSTDLPSPLYHQLYSLIKTNILNGTLHFSEKLPSEDEVAREFDVSRITVKRAMNELANDGLVDRARGKGTHVIYKYTPTPVQAPLVGVLEEIDSIARESVATVFECSMLKPPQAIRTEFGISVSDTLFHLIRTRERVGSVFGYFESWTAGVIVPQNTDIFVRESRHKYFRECGVEFTHTKQTLSAVAADENMADKLAIEVGSPLLHLTRCSYKRENTKEVLVDHLQAFYNPKLFQYQMELNLD